MIEKLHSHSSNSLKFSIVKLLRYIVVVALSSFLMHAYICTIYTYYTYICKYICSKQTLLLGLNYSENNTITIVKIVAFIIVNTITIVAGLSGKSSVKYTKHDLYPRHG